jgi:hypothetical protein
MNIQNYVTSYETSSDQREIKLFLITTVHSSYEFLELSLIVEVLNLERGIASRITNEKM